METTHETKSTEQVPEKTEPVEPPEPPEPWTRRRLIQNREESTLNRVTADVKHEISVKVEDTIGQTSCMDEADEAANVPQEFVIAGICSVKMEREDESSDENGFMEYRPVKMEEELHLICDTEMPEDITDHQSPSTVQEENSILEPGEWLENEIADKGNIERMVHQPEMFEYSKPPEPAAKQQSILYLTEGDELLTLKPERLTNEIAEERSSSVGPVIESIEEREEYYRINRGKGRPPQHFHLTVQEKLSFLERLANERENQGPKWGRPRKHPRPTEEEELTIQRKRAERLANQAAEKEPQSADNQTETVKNANRPKRGRPRKRRLTTENLAKRKSISYSTEGDELTLKPERLTNEIAEERSSIVGPAIESIEVREEYYRTNRGRGRPPQHLRLTVQEKLSFLERLANERENQGPKWGRPRKHPRPTEEEELTIQRKRAERLANQAAEKEPQSADNQTETVKNTNRPKRGRPRKRRLTAENLAKRKSISYSTEGDELTLKPERLTNEIAEERSSIVGPAIESIEVREEYYRTNRGRGRPPQHLRLTVQEKLSFLERLANERENQGPKWGRPRKHPRPTEEEELTIQRNRAERLANQAAEKEPQSADNQTETVKNTNRPKRGRPRKRRLTAENLANETPAQRERRLEYQRWYRRKRKPQKQRAELRESREIIKLQRLAMETEEERAARLEHKRMVALKYRESLTEEEREERLERFRMRWFMYRAQETDEQAAMRRARYRIAYKKKTEKQRIANMERIKMAQLKRSATETEEQKAEQLKPSKIAQRLKYQGKKRQRAAQKLKESVMTEQVDSTNGIFGL
ncbi:trichohyalin-like isoform X2 [Bradysia coprophila]|uniref:trichohyalin-like isoform X2 n=1 Tax=Bradysia coprophila TaxID=38358 RepID=UPI00187D7F30|nr:trichohyalin-like isoform X2 [Bradysia coprophila]